VGIAVGLGFISHHNPALGNRLFTRKIIVFSWLEVCVVN